MALFVLFVVLIVAYSSVFTVQQTEQALVVRLGEPVGVVTEPGLNFKAPFIDSVILIDKRILDLDNPSQEIIAFDRRRLVVDAFARYHALTTRCIYSIEGSIWRAGRHRLEDWQPQPLFEGDGPPYFAVVQSLSDIPPARVWAAIRIPKCWNVTGCHDRRVGVGRGIFRFLVIDRGQRRHDCRRRWPQLGATGRDQRARPPRIRIQSRSCARDRSSIAGARPFGEPDRG